MGYSEPNQAILGNVKLSRAMMSYLGYLWLSPAISGNSWLSLAIFGYLWLSHTISIEYQVSVEAGESKILLIETFIYLFFSLITTDASYRGARAPKNLRGELLTCVFLCIVHCIMFCFVL